MRVNNHSISTASPNERGSSIPSIVIQFIVFVICMYLTMITVNYVKDDEAKSTYNDNGCKLDISGNPVVEPIRSDHGRGPIIRYNYCVTRTPALLLYAVGFMVSITFASLAGRAV